MAVFHHRPGLQVRGRARQRQMLRVPGHHPRGEHRGRHERHHRADRLAGSLKDHRPHYEGSEECQPRVLRLKSEAECDD